MIAIFGPTAVGKSRVAVEVAKRCKGEIVSADSMQVYRGLSILTDQPGPDLLKAVPHHLVGSISPDREYNAALFVRDAEKCLEGIVSRGAVPVLAGGTGLYLRALLGGFSFAGTGEEGSRRRWERFIAEEGCEAAWEELEQMDAEAAAAVDRKNPRRLARALEAAKAALESRSGAMLERERMWSPDSPYKAFSFGLEMDRGELYRRIDARVGEMFERGAVEEVRRTRRGGVSRTAAQAIGFRDICDYLDGNASLEDAIAAIRQRSRRYAKRQLTWMRKMPDIARIDLSAGDVAAAAGTIIERIRTEG
jgi:tRNA dimethylallyltransferase